MMEENKYILVLPHKLLGELGRIITEVEYEALNYPYQRYFKLIEENEIS